MSATETPTAPPRYVTIAELRGRTGLSRTTIYEMIDDDRLSRPKKILGTRRVGWPADYIDTLLGEDLGAAA